MNITQITEPIEFYLNKCAFVPEKPIEITLGSYTYSSSCFTWGLVLTIVFLIILILNWEGVKNIFD